VATFTSQLDKLCCLQKFCLRSAYFLLSHMQ
jgi:hypothetical protein